MKQTIYFFATSISLFFAGACKKDKNDPPAPPKLTLLAKEEFGSVSIQYTYDANNRLISSIYTDPSNTQVTTITKYDDQGRILEKSTDNSTSSDTRDVTVYNAQGNRERVDVYVKSTSGEFLSSVYQYTYNGNKVDVTRKNPATGDIVNSSGYTFDANGNAVEFRGYNFTTGAATSVTNYSNYDDKKHQYANMPKGWSDFSSKNNFGASVQTTVSTGAIINRTHTYEYDADGFPTKRTTLGGTSPVISTYTDQKR